MRGCDGDKRTHTHARTSSPFLLPRPLSLPNSPLLLLLPPTTTSSLGGLTLPQKHLFELCSREAELFCNQNQYKDAIPAASLALKIGREIGEEDALAPCYLLAANAHLGLSQIKQAESCLAQASWVVAKTPDCDPWLRARLYRAVGRLYLYKDKPSHALKQLAEDVYFASLAFSPMDIHTSGLHAFPYNQILLFQQQQTHKG